MNRSDMSELQSVEEAERLWAAIVAALEEDGAKFVSSYGLKMKVAEKLGMDLYENMCPLCEYVEQYPPGYCFRGFCPVFRNADCDEHGHDQFLTAATRNAALSGARRLHARISERLEEMKS